MDTVITAYAAAALALTADDAEPPCSQLPTRAHATGARVVLPPPPPPPCREKLDQPRPGPTETATPAQQTVAPDTRVQPTTAVTRTTHASSHWAGPKATPSLSRAPCSASPLLRREGAACAHYVTTEGVLSAAGRRRCPPMFSRLSLEGEGAINLPPRDHRLSTTGTVLLWTVLRRDAPVCCRALTLGAGAVCGAPAPQHRGRCGRSSGCRRGMTVPVNSRHRR
jgi:hypothetical protein